MSRLKQWAATIPFAALAAASCSTPYALDVASIDYGAEQRGGVIRFTDPKLYRREALINERKLETVYLNGLLKDSVNKPFEPELVRELETISAFTAALGLSFDPAAALNYQRDVETTGIQQEINTLQLQWQLDQLKRDADLFRAKMAAQTEPSTTALPSVGTVGDVTSTTAAAAVNQLTALISRLEANLAAGLNAGSKTPAGVATAKTSPIDEFLERAAYRDLIKSAINAASLDEMHDANGAALIRLQLDATVFPPSKAYMDTFGMLRMEVKPASFGQDAKALDALYFRWLSHANYSLNRRDPSGKSGTAAGVDPRLQTLASIGGFFDIVYWGVPQPGAKPADTRQCAGLQSAPRERTSCRYYAVAMPPGEAYSGGLSNIAQLVDILRTNTAVVENLSAAADKLDVADQAVVLDGSCGLRNGSVLVMTNGMSLDRTVRLARDFQAYWLPIRTASLELRLALQRDEIDVALADFDDERLSQAKQQADELLAVLNRSAACKDRQRTFAGAPTAFKSFIASQTQQHVALYQLGPREQTQKISTVSRAADAINLASAITASFPQSGIGAAGNVGFTRSAMGKADALERAPIVVAFAEAGAEVVKPTEKAGIDAAQTAAPVQSGPNPAFGWLLGPRVTMDPNGKKLSLSHRPAAHELYVDLSVPGWWPYLDLETFTAWSPDWKNAQSVLDADKASKGNIRVALEPTSADMAGLTNAILSSKNLQVIRRPVVQGLSPKKISECATNTRLQIWGDNIWRATNVIIGGAYFDDAKVSVLPDMNGVMVELPVAKFPALDTLETTAPAPALAGGRRDETQTVKTARAQVSVLTPYGVAASTLEITNAGEDCAKPKAPARPAEDTSKKPSISSVTPKSISICDPAPTFTIEGKNLDDKMTAGLATASTTNIKKQGEALVVKFPNAQLRSRLSGMPQAQLTLRSDSGLATADVTIINAQCR